MLLTEFGMRLSTECLSAAIVMENDDTGTRAPLDSFLADCSDWVLQSSVSFLIFKSPCEVMSIRLPRFRAQPADHITTNRHCHRIYSRSFGPVEGQIRRCEDPQVAAKMGRNRKIKNRKDWESVKGSIMLEALKAEFIQNKDL
jgi:hypothetical protein